MGVGTGIGTDIGAAVGERLGAGLGDEEGTGDGTAVGANVATSTDCTLAADMSRRLPEYCDWMAAVKVPVERMAVDMIVTA